MGFPTETVYGLAANAFNTSAVLKVFEIKQRPLFDPLIVHVASLNSSLQRLAEAEIVNGDAIAPVQKEMIERMAAAFWPGPLTLILPKGRNIPDIVSSGLETVGIRVPAHPMAQSLLVQLEFPLAAPSANQFGRVSPTSAEHVWQEFGSRIPGILDGGVCQKGVESTVVEVTARGGIKLLRPGGLSVAAIERVTGVMMETVVRPSSLASPGLLENHYAPAVPLLLLDEERKAGTDLARLIRGRRLAVILPVDDRLFTTQFSFLKPLSLEVLPLTEDGDDQVAARNLFRIMREAAEMADLIIAREVTSEDGLWHAVRDRIKKASFKGSSDDLAVLLDLPSS